MVTWFGSAVNNYRVAAISCSDQEWESGVGLNFCVLRRVRLVGDKKTAVEPRLALHRLVLFKFGQ